MYMYVCSYDVLLQNTELLSLHPNYLQQPDSAASPEEQAQLLALYMATLARAMEHQGWDRDLEKGFL